MIKNILLALFFLIIVFEGYLVFIKLGAASSSAPQDSSVIKGTNPYQLSKGMSLSQSPISSKAFKIVPGDLSDEAKDALDGWNLKTETLSHGSIRATLTPKGSEEMSMQYIITSGNALYFVELNRGDDDEKTGIDKNLHDDYGVIVDKNGMIL